jgi:hypothetical protein
MEGFLPPWLVSASKHGADTKLRFSAYSCYDENSGATHYA